MPNLEGTYYPGAALNLYAWQPAPPIRTEVEYNIMAGLLPLTNVSGRRVHHPRKANALQHEPSSPLVKIYDPVSFDDHETDCHDPFYLRDHSISCEVEAYRRLEPLYGTKVPRFYGHFAAMVPDQDSRTVFVLLLEEVPCRDLRAIGPPHDAEKVCPKHKEATVDAALRLFFDVLAYGVYQQDMVSMNIILRPPKHVSTSRVRFCDTELLVSSWHTL
ncbi:hypothetical protein NP233_g1879 [Leucocoprinus birnbaumii]|uniref:Protein kinase domain-containing protein n=1 Tax=Leucocoprinus birnbaumii TaxID=56174 RepID=A0AAD5W1A8_9AGAR|nr:hypothetical protein NP233_g1879 [Leucocoprinus birnbaumii]